MIIRCPGCNTHYTVDRAAVGSEGKTVRCSQCARTWLQTPFAAPTSVRVAPVPAVAPAPAAAAPPPQPPFAAVAPQPAAIAPQPAVVAPQPVAAPPPPEPAPPEPAPPEPEAEPVPEAETAPEEAAPAEETPESEAAAEAPADVGETLTNEELDEVFGSEEDAPPPLESMVEGAEEEEAAEAIDPDDIPDEPIPQVFTATPPADEDERGLGRGAIVSIAAACVIFGIGAGLYFGRDLVVGLWPGAEPLYGMVGLQKVLGEGLDLRLFRPKWERENDTDIVVVSGIVENKSDEILPLPAIRIILSDEKKEELLTHLVPPPKDELAPGEKTSFRARLMDAPALGRHVDAIWAKPEPAGKGGEEQPPGEGGEKQPAGKGGEEQPPGEGGEKQPAGKGGEEQPPGEGGEKQPAGEGDEAAPMQQGGEADEG